MLRKARFDNLFFVDLPTLEERETIWAIQTHRYGRTPECFHLKRLAEGFADGREPNVKTIEVVIARSVPLARTMAEKIEGLRKWAETRAQYATSQPERPGNQQAGKILAEPGKN